MVHLGGAPIPDLDRALSVMGSLIAHRGPDGHGVWVGPQGNVGLVHRRLSILDLSEAGHQPMVGPQGHALTYNGEIYNEADLRRTFETQWKFRSSSDTEVLFAGHLLIGDAILEKLRGMFAFALWDEPRQRLFCARDRFGIKPFYYTVCGDLFIFASEAKALLPFLPEIATDPQALAEYLTFQYTIGAHTLFRHVRQLLPGHALAVENGRVREWRYWDISYDIDFDHSGTYFSRRLRELVDETVALHLRSDVPVGAYLSGGIDSSLIHSLASVQAGRPLDGFHGRFSQPYGYDESEHARAAAQAVRGALHEVDITADDFRNNIHSVIRALDYPVAGPGAFPQYMVSALAASKVKVVLGGQGGDEIFGGYARYLVAYFEQCLKAAIEGTYLNGNFVVTAESIIPNLTVLQEYKPLLQEFWREGLFGPHDERYFRLVDQSRDITDEVRWEELDRQRVAADFRAIFSNRANVRKGAYLDSMTHFDLKCLIPALLHVEDRMSMAHGLESRVPMLDHPLVEFVATIPADIKFRDGRMKHLLKETFRDALPAPVLNRRDKMGFPVPLKEWLTGPLSGWLHDIFATQKSLSRPYIDNGQVLAGLSRSGRFSRKSWGFLCLELWQQEFHDRAHELRGLLR